MCSFYLLLPLFDTFFLLGPLRIRYQFIDQDSMRSDSKISWQKLSSQKFSLVSISGSFSFFNLLISQICTNTIASKCKNNCLNLLISYGG
jgi:hypothetical protein